MHLQFFLSNFCSQKCGIVYTQFTCWRKKERSSIELSKSISEKRCKLKANETVSEGSEPASGARIVANPDFSLLLF